MDKLKKGFAILLAVVSVLYITWHFGRSYEYKRQDRVLELACLERSADIISVIPSDACLEYFYGE